MTPQPFNADLSRLVDCSRLVGRAFCTAMVGPLAQTLRVPTVLLARIDPRNPQRAHTVAVWTNGAAGQDFSYNLSGSPCSDVLSGQTCLVGDGVVQRYPDDALLVQMGARGYAGAPLRSSDGRVVGLLAAISDAPLDWDTFPVPVLEIFAGRAAAEMEREETISRSEYLGRLVEGSQGEIYVFDAETLCFILVNKGARDNLGYDMAELQAMTPVDIKPEMTTQAFEAALAPLRDGRISQIAFRTRHRRKDGTEYLVEVKVQLLDDLGRPVFFAAIEDVTARATSEDQLRAAEARLRRLIVQSPAGIVEADATGRMTLTNPAWCEMLGRSQDELAGMTIFDLTHPDSMQVTRDAVAMLASGGDGCVIEKNYLHRDGHTINAVSNVSALRGPDGAFHGIAAVVLDVTERVRAESKLRDSEALLRSIIDGTLAFVGMLGTDGTLIEANAQALEVAGISRAEVVGRKFWDCPWWSHDPQVARKLQDAVARAAAGEVQRYDEVIRVRGDGRMTIDFMLAPVFGPDGRVKLLVPSGFDISDRKKQEFLVVSLMHEVNHRSKNLLTVVQSIARQMGRITPDDFTTKFGERLAALAECHDVLVHGGWTNISLRELLASQLTHFACPQGPRVTMDGPDLPLSAAAAQSLGMAIYELATNASKYGSLSNDAGTLAISWRVESAQSDTPLFRLDWRERGGPAVTAQNPAGFGSFVLDELTALSLDATCVKDLRPDGLVWQLSCPMDRLLEVQDPETRLPDPVA